MQLPAPGLAAPPLAMGTLAMATLLNGVGAGVPEMPRRGRRASARVRGVGASEGVWERSGRARARLRNGQPQVPPRWRGHCRSDCSRVTVSRRGQEEGAVARRARSTARGHRCNWTTVQLAEGGACGWLEQGGGVRERRSAARGHSKETADTRGR